MKPDTEMTKKNLPRFTVVSAVYNVAKYLPDFIASLERQTFDPENLQIIVVNDGSTDDSLELLDAWRQRQPDRVTVLSKENGGQGAARDLGLDHCDSEWVTFIDPDDWVDDNYFATVDSFIDANPTVQMLGTYRIFVDEPHMTLRDRHPLRRLFKNEDKLVDLLRFPDYFHGSAPSAFMRVDEIKRQKLRFDERVQPNFEDGHFCARYLLDLDGPPLLGLLGSAHYFYRKRADQSSTLQKSLMDPRRFIDVPRHGYLGILTYAAKRPDGIPLWLKNMILYEISWYFSSDEAAMSAPSAAHGEVGREFIEILGEIVPLLGEGAINGFSMRRYKQIWRDVLLHGLNKDDWFTPYAVAGGYDAKRKCIRLSFIYANEQPEITLLHRGLAVDAQHSKVRTVEYFGQVLLREYLAWAPASGTVRVRLNGSDVEIRKGYVVTQTTMSLRPQKIADWFKLPAKPLALGRRAAIISGLKKQQRALQNAIARRALEQHVIRIAQLIPWVNRRFASAWVLMDRRQDSNDSAEVLFLRLREQYPDVNAWFVLVKGTPDWKRLKPIAGARLVNHGSLRWKLLMMSCTVLISSHVDEPIRTPAELSHLRRPDWKFVFLQHGVIKNDLSRWLNSKKIDLFVTSTPAEQESIAGDGNAYAYSTKEVKMTGLPRFDALLAAKARLGDRQPDLVIIAPTWRHWLSLLMPDGSENPEALENFLSSDFAQNWSAVLESQALRHSIESAGARLAFLPHPNIRPAVAAMALGKDLLVLEYAQADLHGYFARARVLVTDYSSMAFNAAFLERPVVYYQFDAERVKLGGHVGHEGYFDYERDGFGPVVDSASGAIEAISGILVNGPADEHFERIMSTFPHKDGKCSDRVIYEIRQIV